jgi:tetratricopeptide (TPR) repeat protein
MKSQNIQNRIVELFSIFVAQVKGHTAIGNTDINRIAETVLIPVFKEVYGYRDLKNLNDSEGNNNYPAIDLGDETAKIAIQVTATPDSEKIKDTLRGFIKHEFYQTYERVQIYILTEKQKSYSGRGFQEIIQNKIQFDTKQDILDSRDLLKQITIFQVEQLQRICDILEANFGESIKLNSPTSIPSNLPRSGVVKFVGRTQKLIDLHAQLQQNDRIAITAITGMGGIGKTELALQYAIAQLKQSYYPAGLCWLRARDQEIATQIVTFAQAHLGLRPPDQLEIDTQVRFCWQQWPEGNALVVLDDMTDYDAIQPYLPPPDPRFKLLITTRLKLGRSVEEFEIEELDEDGAITLLESLVGGDRIQAQIEDVKALCKRVGYLPLGLELLGRFLARKPDWTVSRLIEQLASKSLAAKALIETEAGMTAQLGVAEALELSWQELNKAEQELAYVLGMFAIAPIPWSLVEQCHSNVDPDELEDTRDVGLIARSLLRRFGEGTYQLHQIVQEYFRIKLERRSDQGYEIKSNFCRVMVAISQTVEQDPTIDQVDRVRGAIAHLEEVMNQWIDCIKKEDLVLPFIGVGRFYESQGNYTLTESYYRQCVEVTQKLLNSEHPDIPGSLNNLGSFYRFQGRYEEAESLCLQALKMRQNLLGLEHPHVSGSLNDLALLYESQGRYEEAEALYLQALHIDENQLVSERPNVSTCLNNLALLYRLQGRYEEAELRCLQSLQMRQNLLGSDSLDVANSHNTLALIYRSQERYEEAEPLYLQSLQMRQKLLGLKHLDVADSLNNLSLLYYFQERNEEAEVLCLQALQIYQNLLGSEHPSIATSLNSLAGFSHSQGRYEEAEALYLQALQMRQKLLGSEHPNVATIQLNLGTLYQEKGQCGKAKWLYLQAIVIAEANLGPNHPTTQVIHNRLNSLPQSP